MKESKDHRAQILIVDDEESIRFTFQSFLIEAGYTVVTAGSYEEALARIDETDFDLIFIDIMLRGRGGLDVLREISTRKLPVPVIMITGHPNAVSAHEAFELGAFAHISKPIRQEKLLLLAKSALRSSRH